MGKKLYVGNLGYGVTDADLLKMFEAHGTVQSAQVIMDRDAGRSKGFGFVEMGSDQEAQAAIAALGGKEMDGRALTVNEARPKTEGSRGGAGGGSAGAATAAAAVEAAVDTKDARKNNLSRERGALSGPKPLPYGRGSDSPLSLLELFFRGP